MLNSMECKAVEDNKGKKITFRSNVGDIVTGYIHGGQSHQNYFTYQLSPARKPRTEFNMAGRGDWYAVNPMQIIEMTNA